MKHGYPMQIWQFLSLCRTLSARGRATHQRLLGARLGRKTTIGPRTHIDRPWTLSAGDRVTMEQDVFIKVVADDAIVQLGDSCFLGRGVELNVLSRISLGEHTLIAPGAFIVDHTHGLAPNRRIDEQDCLVGPVSLGNDVWVGTGAVILPGVHIADGAVVAAGAVVRADVPSNAIVAGVPAKVKRYRSDVQ